MIRKMLGTQRMRILKTLALALGGLVLGQHAQAAEDFLAGIPRNQVLIAENPEGTVTDPSNFNVWVAGSRTAPRRDSSSCAWTRSGTSTRIRVSTAKVWDNSLAADKPQYNKDFTEMTVKLRPGIMWSDGDRVHRR